MASAVSLFCLSVPTAIFATVSMMVLASIIITLYHYATPRYSKSSVSQSRKLMLVVPLVIVLSFLSISSLNLTEPMPSSVNLLWLALLLFFYFDTFRSSLTYFGKRRPLVKDVRMYYHFSLIFLHISISAFICGIISILAFYEILPLVDNSVVWYTEDFAVSAIFLFNFLLLWMIYRRSHAVGERQALQDYGDEFAEQYRTGIPSALSQEEISRYV